MLRLTLFATVLACTLTGCSDERRDARIVGALASDRVELAADVSERIDAILVDEGQRVAAGDVLLEFDTSRITPKLAEAEAALAEAEARQAELVRGPRRERITAARAGVDGAEKELAFRRAEFERIRDVHSRGLISAEALDGARAAYDTAAANLEQRRAELEELLSGTTVEELKQAEAAVRRAAALRDSVRVDLDRHTLRAPADGVVDSRVFEIGEHPVAGQAVIVMLAGDQPYARVYVPEALRVRIAPGDPARVYVDGLDEVIDARVRWIASDAAFTPYFALTERDRGRLSYVAKIDLTGERARLPDGVPVEVEFTALASVE